MNGSAQTKITFFGTSPALPDVGGDSPTFLINENILVDTGWSSVSNLRNIGVSPLDIEYLFLTHLHHDHYISLPSFLFFWLMSGKNLQSLKIIGPVNDVERIVNRALSFLQEEMYFKEGAVPTIIPLQPGESYEDGQVAFHTFATVHPVQSLGFRFIDKATGKWFSYTGDTAPHRPIAQHVKGSPLLIHEAALGARAADPQNNSYMHSGALDAAAIASEAEAGKLVMLHASNDKAEQSVEAAKQVFAGEVLWPKVGQTIIL